jgi:hypothetical protein
MNLNTIAFLVLVGKAKKYRHNQKDIIKQEF